MTCRLGIIPGSEQHANKRKDTVNVNRISTTMGRMKEMFQKYDPAKIK
jgi:hypothetical protein